MLFRPDKADPIFLLMEPKKNEPIPSGPSSIDRMTHESPWIREMKTYVEKVARTDSTLLITGETGTGKEFLAGLIHKSSLRCERPLIRVNCAAIPDSLLESELFGYERGAFTGAHSLKEGLMMLANGGTLFLDEIADMSSYAQAKILRAIENKEIYRLGGVRSVPLDIRIIAATSRDLTQLLSEDKFRKDLYFRLNVVKIHIPPLRDRKNDIEFLVNQIIPELNHRFNRKIKGLTEEALATLIHYDWPGNIRELKNLLETIFINLPPQAASFVDLPEPFHIQLMATKYLPQDERSCLLSALVSTRWNISKAAQKLNWSRMTLYRKIMKYKIVKEGESSD